MELTPKDPNVPDPRGPVIADAEVSDLRGPQDASAGSDAEVSIPLSKWPYIRHVPPGDPSAPPPPPGPPPMAADRTAGASMWPDQVPNKDVMAGGWKLPKPAAPFYLLITKGDPDPNAGLTMGEESQLAKFSRKDWERTPSVHPQRVDYRQTLPDRWFPTADARALLVYYQPWRLLVHNPQVGDYFKTVKDAAMVSLKYVASANTWTIPCEQNQLSPIPRQELNLVRQGMYAYWRALQHQGVDVPAPMIFPEHLWVGYWDDYQVETAVGSKVATMCVVHETGEEGREHATQCAFYLWSQLRNLILYPEAERDWAECFNRVNILEPRWGHNLPTVHWGIQWKEFVDTTQSGSWNDAVDWQSATMEQLSTETGGFHQMQQRMVQMQMELAKAEQVPSSSRLPPPPHLTPGPDRTGINSCCCCQDQTGKPLQHNFKAALCQQGPRGHAVGGQVSSATRG
jgi:hypothetical protein